MPTFIALLRGINVGKAKRISMAKLRALLGELDHTDVATLLNSGNVVFHASKGTSTKLAGEITAAIANKLDVRVPVLVKPARELAAIVKENSLAPGADDHSRLLVVFTQGARDLRSLETLASLAGPNEACKLGKHAAYVHCTDGILDSKIGKALLGKTGKIATTRNWATVLKLQALADGRDD